MKYNYNWDAVRAMYEAGEAVTVIAKKPQMPSKQAICVRANNENWTRRSEVDQGELIPFDGLTDKQRVVVKEVSEGMPQKWAAAVAGVHETTVSDWKRDPVFANAVLAATGVFAKRQLRKVTDATDWRSGMAMLERHVATRDHFAPANAHKGMTGATFNVLGHVNLGFDRTEAAESLPLIEGETA